MKKAVGAFLQFILFVFVFGAGSLFPPFHIEHVILATPGTTRIFVGDGLILMLALFCLILLVEALRKRFISAGPWTTSAFILAAATGFWMEFGFKTISR
jgi:hypothetical protein